MVNVSVGTPDQPEPATAGYTTLRGATAPVSLRTGTSTLNSSASRTGDTGHDQRGAREIASARLPRLILSSVGTLLVRISSRDRV